MSLLEEKEDRLGEILIFGGTTEGRRLSEYLAVAGICHTLCVATEYGEEVLEANPFANVHRGRMDGEEIRRFISKGNFRGVVDATHPYAKIATRSIKEAMEGMGIPYLRLKREDDLGMEKENTPGREESDIIYFDTEEACAGALEDVEGNILLTTGSKELSKYCRREKVKERLYVRVLPSMESLARCMEQGIGGKRIIAMQGPFTSAMNEATIQQYGISCLVTKECGKAGGFYEKLEAARRTGIKAFVIGRPKEEEGDSFAEICRKLEQLLEKKECRHPESPLKITLAGMGMGNRNNMTKEVQDAIHEADIALGAERLLASISPRMEKRPLYRAEEVIPYLAMVQKECLPMEERKIVILFSGDSGFYSGCQKLYRALEEEVQEGRLAASLHVLPGISSVAALAARIGESYQDASVYSMHGKEVPGLIGKIDRNGKTFLLLSGVQNMHKLGNLIMSSGRQGWEVTVGYQLSYEEEWVRRLSPEECCKLREEGLYICMIKNPFARGRRLTHGLPDGEFIREKVPMTKEEVREIAICKLRLSEGSVVYDIGSGTGSVAVEIAGLSDEIQVYAVERKKEAAALIEKNKEKFQLENIAVVEAKAPEGLGLLPAATHAFIGGSGGCLKEILEELHRINHKMRIVINAVSMETICEIREYLPIYGIKKEEVVQVQINRAKERGSHHLMEAENPVWIWAFDFEG